METYINEAACRGVIPRFFEKANVEARRFLVAKLLAQREQARLLVAPTGFGKSYLAARYASLVFSFWHVFWFDCQDLRFLRALSEGALDQLIYKRDSAVSLVVFDDVPVLDEHQAQAFAACVGRLRAQGCEVIACATPVCAASFAHDDAWGFVANHKLLAVQNSEQMDAAAPSAVSANPQRCDAADAAGAADAAEAAALRRRVPALFWEDGAGEFTLIRGFAFDELPVIDVLAGLFLFSAGKVAAGDIERATRAVGAQRFAAGEGEQSPLCEALSRLAREYPYFRCSDDGASFATFTCDDALFERVVLPLVYETASFLDEEEALMSMRFLVELLSGEQTAPRACAAAQYLLNPRERVAFLQDKAPFWAFAAPAESYGRLVRSAASVNPADTGALAASAVFAQALETLTGTGCATETGFSTAANESAVFGAGALSGESLGEQCANRQLCLDARFLYAALALRAFSEEKRAALRAQGEAGSDEAHLLFSLHRSAGEACGGEPGSAQGEESWTAQLFCFAFELAFYPDALSTDAFCRRARQKLGCMPAQLASLCLFWYSCDAARKMGAAQKRSILQLVENLAGTNLPSKAKRCLDQARVLLAEKKQRSGRRASSWDYHTVSIPHLKVNLCGAFSARIGSRVLDERNFKRKKSMALLAMLALEGGGLNRDYLVEALWPDSSLACARRNFYAIWCDLRKTLCLEDGSCPYLIRTGTSYCLNAALVECDVRQAEELCRLLCDPHAPSSALNRAFSALTLQLSGEMMSGVPANDYLERYCAALRTSVEDALVTAGRALLERGCEPEALRYAQAALVRSPGREDACEIAMKAQINLGQRASALTTFLACQRFLSDQLGVDPSPCVCALYEQALGVTA